MDYYFYTEGLTVGYDGKPVVRDVEIGINKGEILSLIGPNGAGKTTILKNIIRQLAPIAGVAVIEKKSIADMDARELSKQMAVVLTTPLKSELMTVREIVETGRYPYTGRFGILGEQDRKIVEEAMGLIHVDEIADEDFTRISDGQRQRVMLARALAQEPDIIVLDEPTSFLDIKYKMEFLSILRKLSREQGLTVIMSLHEVEMAKCVSDKIACFKDARLDRFGAPQEIYRAGYINELYGINTDELTPEFAQMAAGLSASAEKAVVGKCQKTKCQGGKLYGIGVGPGEPELMTLKSVNAIRACDVIVLPAATKEECYAYQIVSQILRADELNSKSIMCREFPMIKDATELSDAHQQIFADIKTALDLGKIVGILTIGDPTIYSTYMYIHKLAQLSGYETEIINGVPSFCAAAARIGISLGEKGQQIHIIPGSYSVEESLKLPGTKIYMKSGKKLAKLCDAIENMPSAGNVWAISSCGMSNEEIFRGIEKVREAEAYLTIVIVC